jgi:hypothetical protein
MDGWELSRTTNISHIQGETRHSEGGFDDVSFPPIDLLPHLREQIRSGVSVFDLGLIYIAFVTCLVAVRGQRCYLVLFAELLQGFTKAETKKGYIAREAAERLAAKGDTMEVLGGPVSFRF